MEMSDAESLLEEIGFSKLEAKLYMLLLYESNLKPVEIQKKLSIYKSTFYDAASRLEKKGLLTRIKTGKNMLFRAAEPSTLISLLAEISKKIEQNIKKPPEKEKTIIEIYNGKKAVTALMRRMLVEIDNGEKSYYDFGASGKFRIVLPVFWDYWQAYKKENHIRAKVIFTKQIENVKNIIQDYAGEAKSLPPKITSFTDTFIYNDVVVLFIWLDEPVAIYIKNKENATSYKNQFEVMWRYTDIKEKKVLQKVSRAKFKKHF